MGRSARRRLFEAERLEPRHLLAAQLLITELAAHPSSAIVDDDGDRTDWIELYNAGDEAANLAGWHLTDDAGDLSKWQFPATELAPRQYLLVYASGIFYTGDRDGPLRSNVPDEVSWDSRAPGIVRTSNSSVAENVSKFAEHLRPGINILAVQGLNRSITDRDFLIMTELDTGTVTSAGFSPSALRFTDPIVIDRNSVVRARAFRAGDWSPIVEAVFDTQSVPLRVAELMYHPTDPTARELELGFQDDDDFEFIELVNISSDETLDLTGFQIQGGIEFTFPSMTLPPGQRTVLVRNAQAFDQRYGSGPQVAGEYTRGDGGNRLSNAGESLRIHDAQGILIQEFSYDDAWESETDGGGRSLQVVDTMAADLRIWSQPDGWQSSRMRDGSPGTPDRVPGDANGDGVFDSNDLILIFQINEYEDKIDRNSTFDEGDWNGDGDFTTQDLILAFQAGNYVNAAVDRVFADDV